MEKDIYDFQETVETKVDFEEFLKRLKSHLKDSPEEWENDTLDLFLDGLYGYNYDSKNDPEPITPSWKLFAEMLLAAKVYE